MALSSPLDITVTERGHNSISFSWTAGVDSTKTMIRYKEGQYPSSTSDGELGYLGSGTECKITNLDINKKYHFRFWGTTDAYSLSAVTDTDTTGMVPLGMACDNKYLYISGTGGAVRQYLRDDYSLVDTLDVGGTALVGERVSKRGRYLAFVYAAKAYIYDMSTKTVILNATIDTAPGADSMRSVAIDHEEEYVYFGNIDGTIIYYDIATLTQRTFKPGTDYIRSIDAEDDLLVCGSNDNHAYVIDRSDRTAMSTTTTLAGVTSTVEVTRIWDDYIFIGGDQSNGTVIIYDKTSPYAAVQTLTDCTDDITGICPILGYLLVASDDTQAYLYTGAPGTYALTETFNEAGNDYVEDCCLLEDGTLYFVMGQGSSTEKLYSYDYLSFTYSTTYNDIKGITDVRLNTPKLPDQNVIMYHDFGYPGYWKEDGLVLVGAEQVNGGIRLNGDNQYATWETRNRLDNLTQITLKMKFTPDFAYNVDKEIMFWGSDATKIAMVKRADSHGSSNYIRVYLGNATIRDIAPGIWAQYWLPNQINEFVLSGKTNNTTVWLNGKNICANDGSGWSGLDTSTFTIGAYPGGLSPMSGIVHSIILRDDLITNPTD